MALKLVHAGSFLGLVSLSLLVMQWLGVSAAVLVRGPAAGGSLRWLAPREPLGLARLGTGPWVAAASVAICPCPQVLDTAYADYEVRPCGTAGADQSRGFPLVFHSLASLMDDSEPPHYARYLQRRLRHILLDELALPTATFWCWERAAVSRCRTASPPTATPRGHRPRHPHTGRAAFS